MPKILGLSVMILMRCIRLSFSLLAIIPSLVFGSERLEPCRQGTEDYRSRYAELITRSVPQEIVLSANVFPSFAGEWAVQIVEDGDKYIVAYVQFEEPLWYSATAGTGNGVTRNFSTAVVNIQTRKSYPVSQVLVNKLIAEWNRSISGATKPDVLELDDVLGLDGIIYEFALPGDKCGSAWSPSRGSRNSHLVTVIELLRDLAALDTAFLDRKSEEHLLDALKAIPMML